MATLIPTRCFGDTYHLPQHDFAITVPDGWRPISPEVIRAVNQTSSNLGSAFPSLSVPRYDCGWQEASGPTLTYPYVLVKVDNSGRVPESALRKTLDLDTSDVKQIQTHYSNFVSSLEVGQFAYDRRAQILWFNGGASLSSGRRFRFLGALVLTDRGSIRVYQYALQDTFADYASTFVEIARSVTLGESLQYHPNRSHFWTKTAARAIAALIISLLCVLFVLFRGKKRSGQHEFFRDSDQ